MPQILPPRGKLHKWNFKMEKGHGRIDSRSNKVFPVESILTAEVAQC